MATKTDGMKILKKVMDPEIGISITDLGLIYGVEVDGESVRIKMTLTTPHCPLVSLILEEVKQKVGGLKGVKSVEVQLVFDPPWSPEKISKQAKKKLGFV